MNPTAICLVLPTLYTIIVPDLSQNNPIKHDQFVNIYISTHVNNTLNITYPFPGWDPECFTLNENESKELKLTLTPEDIKYLSNESITVTSMKTLNIQMFFGRTSTSLIGSYAVFPVTTKSTDFYLGSYAEKNELFKPTFYVGAGEVAVEVKAFVKNSDSQSQGSQGIWTKSLQPYEVTSVITSDLMVDSITDFTGVFITSSAPVTILSGHHCAHIPNPDESRHCGMLIQQIPPVSTWGQTYMAGPISGRASDVGYILRTVFSKPNTGITLHTPSGQDQISELVNVNLNSSSISISQLEVRCLSESVNSMVCETSSLPGNFLEVEVTKASTDVMISCSAPCLVLLYNPGHTAKDMYHTSPLMVLTPQLNCSNDALKFSTMSAIIQNQTEQYANYINVISSGGSHDSLTLTTYDGQVETLGNNTPTRIGNYDVISVKLAHDGFYTLSTSDPRQKICGSLYGHLKTSISRSAYALPLGYPLRTKHVDPPVQTSNMSFPTEVTTETMTGTTTDIGVPADQDHDVPVYVYIIVLVVAPIVIGIIVLAIFLHRRSMKKKSKPKVLPDPRLPVPVTPDAVPMYELSKTSTNEGSNMSPSTGRSPPSNKLPPGMMSPAAIMAANTTRTVNQIDMKATNNSVMDDGKIFPTRSNQMPESHPGTETRSNQMPEPHPGTETRSNQMPKSHPGTENGLGPRATSDGSNEYSYPKPADMISEIQEHLYENQVQSSHSNGYLCPVPATNNTITKQPQANIKKNQKIQRLEMTVPVASPYEALEEQTRIPATTPPYQIPFHKHSGSSPEYENAPWTLPRDRRRSKLYSNIQGYSNHHNSSQGASRQFQRQKSASTSWLPDTSEYEVIGSERLSDEQHRAPAPPPRALFTLPPEERIPGRTEERVVHDYLRLYSLTDPGSTSTVPPQNMDH